MSLFVVLLKFSITQLAESNLGLPTEQRFSYEVTLWLQVWETNANRIRYWQRISERILTTQASAQYAENTA